MTTYGQKKLTTLYAGDFLNLHPYWLLPNSIALTFAALHLCIYLMWCWWWSSWFHIKTYLFYHTITPSAINGSKSNENSFNNNRKFSAFHISILKRFRWESKRLLFWKPRRMSCCVPVTLPAAVQTAGGEEGEEGERLGRRRRREAAARDTVTCKRTHMVLPQRSTQHRDSPTNLRHSCKPNFFHKTSSFQFSFPLLSLLPASSHPPEAHCRSDLGRWSSAMARENGDAGRGETWKKQVDDIKKIFDFKEVLGTWVRAPPLNFPSDTSVVLWWIRLPRWTCVAPSTDFTVTLTRQLVASQVSADICVNTETWTQHFSE